MLVALLGVQDELMNLKVKSGLASPTLPEKGQKKKKEPAQTPVKENR